MEALGIGYLWKKIEDNRRRSISGQYFLPNSARREIFTLENIRRAVNELECEDHERIGLTEKVFNQGTIVFAILVWMRQESAIIDFRNHDALDKSLPLNEKRVLEIAPGFGKTLSTETQWGFLPYTFNSDMCDHHVLIHDYERILPFLPEEDTFAEGAFGKVSRVAVLASQQEFFSSKTSTADQVTIIRKQIKIDTRSDKDKIREAFLRETNCLKVLNRLRHPNIVPLLGSYTHRGEHNFLFPLLDMDLGKFLSSGDRFGDFKWDFTFFAALHGLSSALHNVHIVRLNTQQHGVELTALGYHHDFRPANILVSQTTFLIADFGLSKLKYNEVNSETNWKTGVGDYFAPECMNSDLVCQQVGRAIDVWAFGCLLAEIATYMELGPKGVKAFRARRLSAGFSSCWEDQYFFCRQGIKPAISEWFQGLLANPKTELLHELVQLSVAVLQIEPISRPKASVVTEKLSFLSIQAHCRAIQQAFVDYFSIVRQMGDEGPPLMKLWFERERFNALGAVLGATRGNHMIPDVLLEVKDFHDSARGNFVSLFSRLKSEIRQISEERSGVICIEPLMSNDFRQSFYEEVQRLVQDLCDILPPRHQKKMDTVWRHASLDTEDIDRLDMIKVNSHSVGQTQYLEVSALASMKLLRLQLLNGSGTVAGDIFISKKDVELRHDVSGHQIGLFREQYVLVEWLYYSPEWEAMPVAQRSLLMELRAQGLGVNPKPSGLRILDCVGVFEETEGQHGYGFVYAIPDQDVGNGLIKPPCTTLRDLLVHDRRSSSSQQPLLDSKFKLAYTLVNFINELHEVGWLHENINSNNIIFFNLIITHTLDSIMLSEALRKPYVVDFRKSRPDRDTWYTAGPSDDSAFTDYRHPKYSRTSRFVPEYDYYSMGLVLLEIGLWTPLEVWSSRCRNLIPNKFRETLIEKYVPRLGQKMGRIYRDIVLACLEGFEEAGNENSATTTTFMRYYEKVVAPLEELAKTPL